MTVIKFQTDEERQAEAVDKMADLFRANYQANQNFWRNFAWRFRFHNATGIWPSHTTAYPTLKGEK